MISSYPSIVFGYHGCDRSVGEAVISGRCSLQLSKNSYDWLGSGIYFWENTPFRALSWARECAKDPRLSKGKINEPFVLGAIIDLRQCLNLTDEAHMEVLKEAYSHLKKTFALSGKGLPSNKNNSHNLDCMVINTAVTLNRKSGNDNFDTVRGAYIEGAPIYPEAKIYERTHIQLCVRNPECILGYFSPDVNAS